MGYNEDKKMSNKIILKDKNNKLVELIEDTPEECCVILLITTMNYFKELFL